MNIVNWITENWIAIGAAVALTVNLARIIVKLTPTPKDDTFLETIVDGLKHIGLVVKDKAQVLLLSGVLLLIPSCTSFVAFVTSPTGRVFSQVAANELGKLEDKILVKYGPKTSAKNPPSTRVNP